MARTIIAGSRGITDYKLLCEVIERSGFTITEVVEGECENSPDVLGKRWAIEHGIPYKPFPAKWDDIKAPGALVKRNKNGKLYNVLAGFWRNEDMAKYTAENNKTERGQVILLWNGTSPGTRDMKKLTFEYGLKPYFAKV